MKVNAILEAEHLSFEEAEELHAFKGWALYRQKNFEEAREEALRAQNTERGLRCLAAIESYLGNLEEAKSYLEKLPNTPAKANARMIGFREPTDLTPKEEVLAVAYEWVNEIIDKTNTANLMNNTARWLLAKSKGKEDMMLALGFMRSAIELYGAGTTNLHHRASANFWVSKIMEELFGAQAAVTAAEESLTLWEIQLSLDPENKKNFANSREGAANRLRELNHGGINRNNNLHEARIIYHLPADSTLTCGIMPLPANAEEISARTNEVVTPADNIMWV